MAGRKDWDGHGCDGDKEKRRKGEQTLMIGLRTCFLAINILDSLTSEGLQTDISPVCPPLLPFHLPSQSLHILGLSTGSREIWVELIDSKQTKNVWARDE
jgi:hypothetical protein